MHVQQHHLSAQHKLLIMLNACSAGTAPRWIDKENTEGTLSSTDMQISRHSGPCYLVAAGIGARHTQSYYSCCSADHSAGNAATYADPTAAARGSASLPTAVGVLLTHSDRVIAPGTHQLIVDSTGVVLTGITERVYHHAQSCMCWYLSSLQAVCATAHLPCARGQQVGLDRMQGCKDCKQTGSPSVLLISGANVSGQKDQECVCLSSLQSPKPPPPPVRPVTSTSHWGWSDSERCREGGGHLLPRKLFTVICCETESKVGREQPPNKAQSKGRRRRQARHTHTHTHTWGGPRSGNGRQQQHLSVTPGQCERNVCHARCRRNPWPARDRWHPLHQRHGREHGERQQSQHPQCWRRMRVKRAQRLPTFLVTGAASHA